MCVSHGRDASENSSCFGSKSKIYSENESEVN